MVLPQNKPTVTTEQVTGFLLEAPINMDSTYFWNVNDWDGLPSKEAHDQNREPLIDRVEDMWIITKIRVPFGYP